MVELLDGLIRAADDEGDTELGALYRAAKAGDAKAGRRVLSLIGAVLGSGQWPSGGKGLWTDTYLPWPSI
jgi:hypothetical protein